MGIFAYFLATVVVHSARSRLDEGDSSKDGRPGLLRRDSANNLTEDILGTLENVSLAASSAKSSFHSVIALRINCPPEKLIDKVTVQLPTRFSQPVTQLAIGAYFFVAIIADQ